MTSAELPIACVPPVDQVGSRKHGDLMIWSEENQGKKQRACYEPQEARSHRHAQVLTGSTCVYTSYIVPHVAAATVGIRLSGTQRRWFTHFRLLTLQQEGRPPEDGEHSGGVI